MVVGLGTREVVGAGQGRLRVVRVRGRRGAGGVQGWALVQGKIEVDTGKRVCHRIDLPTPLDSASLGGLRLGLGTRL